MKKITKWKELTIGDKVIFKYKNRKEHYDDYLGVFCGLKNKSNTFILTNIRSGRNRPREIFATDWFNCNGGYSMYKITEKELEEINNLLILNKI